MHIQPQSTRLHIRFTMYSQREDGKAGLTRDLLSTPMPWLVRYVPIASMRQTIFYCYMPDRSFRVVGWMEDIKMIEMDIE